MLMFDKQTNRHRGELKEKEKKNRKLGKFMNKLNGNF